MTIFIVAWLALASTERYSDPFDLDAERHVAQAMLAELHGNSTALVAELELAHLYSPTNPWITEELVVHLLQDGLNVTRAREVIETALLYDPESPGLNRIYALFELAYGSSKPRVISSLWRLVEHPATRVLGRELLELVEGPERRAVFSPKGPAECLELALAVISMTEPDELKNIVRLHTDTRGCWR